MDGPPHETRYDPQELRRLLGLSFSASALAQLARRWSVEASGTADDVAHALVRTVEARGELASLVEQLKQEKPLVVWPEPKPVQPPPAAASEPEQEAEGPPALMGESGPADGGPTEQARASEQGAPVPSGPGPPPSPAADPAASAAASAPASRPVVDPFLTEPDVERERHARQRMLLIGAALAGGVGLGAVGMWLVFRDAPEAEPAAEEGPPSPAAAAATSLRGAVDAALAACDATPDDPSARGALAAAFRRCSLPEIQPSRIRTTPPPRPRPEPQPRQVPAPRPAPKPVDAKKACLEACYSERKRCNRNRCGEEPRSASEYPRYQQCLSKCLTPYLKCRQRCR